MATKSSPSKPGTPPGKTRAWLSFLPSNARAFAGLAVLGLVAYAITLSTFFANNSRKGSYVSAYDSTATGFFSLTLKSIDYAAGRIRFDAEVNMPEGRGKITKCFWYGSRFWYSGGNSASLSPAVVELVEVPRESMQPLERPGPGFTSYRGGGEFTFDTDLRLYPFDKVWWDFRVGDECWTPSAKIDSGSFRNLFVHNNLTGYSLSIVPDDEDGGIPSHPYFLLQRSLFLRVLAAIIFTVAFVSSLLLMVKSPKEKKDLSFLTYFAGLWAIRTILLAPIKDLNAFPTLIEMTILFLFCFTIIGTTWASTRESGGAKD